MTDNKISNTPTNNEEINQFILREFPYPIAVSYQKLLEATTWRAIIDEGLKIFEFGLRTVALVLINQYLNEDIKKVNNESFNQLLLSKLPEATLGSWVELFFRSLQVYEGKQDLFFTPELYEILWDILKEPHVKHKGARGPFDRLTQLRNARAHLRLADTEENAQEILQNLQATLTQFTFIHQYDLIQITEKLNEEQCRFDIYRGLTITSDLGKLKLWHKGEKKLHENWFYLLRRTPKGQEVLELHPFLVAWVQDAQTATQEKTLSHGIALYDRLLKTKVSYISLPDQITVEHERPLLDHVRSILYFVIEEQRMGQGGKIKFSWQELTAAAQELSVRNMKGVRQKYSPELYLQREETFQQFNDFLASDKTAFVLTGKSGVGKSNFVLSLADAYTEKDTLCYLMYDGARLSVPDKMQDTISQDLGRRLELVDTMRKDLFTTLEHQGVMINRRLLIIFDAINENANGKELLQKIDKLVDIGDDFPWLKVLITSRPHAWHTLKRGLHLASENYFQPEGGDDLTVEMAEFAIKLEEFERGELELAYEKYRIVYDLQTSYQDLPVSIRETLRDPLVLRLIADIYRYKALPETIRVSDIYEKYVDTLVTTDRLEHEDLIFLEREIVPRMLSSDHFDNKLTTAQIAQEKTSDGRPLWEMIRVSEQLSGGETINASYQRLAEAEILIQQGSSTDYEVSFKYERFYDYYGGKRLRELAKSQSSGELLETYEKWILETQQHPFLWGSVQSALLNELKLEKEELIITLCQTGEQLAKDMMVATLTEYGQEEERISGALANTKSLLYKLLSLGRGEVSLWQKLLPISDVIFSQEVINARKTAVDVGGKLGLTGVLERGNLDRSPSVRNHTLAQTINLWHKDIEDGKGSISNNRGFSVVQNILKQVRPHILPNIYAIETGGLMLAYIFIVTYKKLRTGEESALKQELRIVTKEVINRLLFVDQNSFFTKFMRRFVREWLISNMVKFAVKTTEDSPEKFTFNARNVETFLKRPQEEKVFIKKITQYIDSKNRDFRELEEALPKVFKYREGSVDYALMVALTAQWRHSQKQTLELAQYVFQEEMRYVNEASEENGTAIPSYIAFVPFDSVGGMLHRDILKTKNNQLEDEKKKVFLKDAAVLLQDWSIRLIEKAKGQHLFGEYVYLRSLFPDYLDMQHALKEAGFIKKPELEPLLDFVEQAIKHNDSQFIRAIVWDFNTLASRTDLYYLILEILKPLLILLKTRPEKEERTIFLQEKIIELLAHMRRFEPYTLDDYMVQNDLSSTLQRRVKTVEVKDQVGGDFIQVPLAMFISDATSSSPELQQVARWCLECTIDCETMEQFLNLIIRKFINLAYGDELFPLSR